MVEEGANSQRNNGRHSSSGGPRLNCNYYISRFPFEPGKPSFSRRVNCAPISAFPPICCTGPEDQPWDVHFLVAQMRTVDAAHTALRLTGIVAACAYGTCKVVTIASRMSLRSESSIELIDRDLARLGCNPSGEPSGA